MNRIFLVVALISFHSHAQDSLKSVSVALPEDAPSDFSHWRIGVSFSPDIAYRTLSGDNESAIKQRNNAESALFGYTTGANVAYHLGNRFSIESGVHFSPKGYRSVIQVTDSEAQVVGEGVIKDVYDYLEMPVKVNYITGKAPVRWTFGAGVIGGWLLEARSIIKYDKTNTYTVTDNFERFNLSATISAGIDWQIAPRLNLKAEPTLRYGLTKISDAAIDTRLWNLGLQTGIYFGL
jgi:hypothetical protein